jgi:hypothetical protein
MHTRQIISSLKGTSNKRMLLQQKAHYRTRRELSSRDAKSYYGERLFVIYLLNKGVSGVST